MASELLARPAVPQQPTPAGPIDFKMTQETVASNRNQFDVQGSNLMSALLNKKMEDDAVKMSIASEFDRPNRGVNSNNFAPNNQPPNNFAPNNLPPNNFAPNNFASG